MDDIESLSKISVQTPKTQISYKVKLNKVFSNAVEQI